MIKVSYVYWHKDAYGEYKSLMNCWEFKDLDNAVRSYCRNIENFIDDENIKSAQIALYVDNRCLARTIVPFER